MFKSINKMLKKVEWHNLRNLEPISRKFGFDRGTPIDRVYIESFLQKNKSDITGVVCEIADSEYSKKYGLNVIKFEILHYTNDNHKATIVGDLTKIETLPNNAIDCLILTQTLNFIEDIDSAIKGIYHILKPNGVALITVAGLCQISRYDMDRWGDYWRFTDLSLQKVLMKCFEEKQITIETFGNVLTATSLLQGINAEELSNDELEFKDKDYQVIITARVQKL